jgi:hypothetical protein
MMSGSVNGGAVSRRFGLLAREEKRALGHEASWFEVIVESGKELELTTR